MDIIDNLLYATYASPLQINTGTSTPHYPVDQRIISEYIARFIGTDSGTIDPPIQVGVDILIGDIGYPGDPVYSYQLDTKLNFCAYQDPDVIEATMLRHWYDINQKVDYRENGIPGTTSTPTDKLYASFKSSPYHLIFAYLIENTRILQIFERLIEKYQYDEEFGIAADATAFNWIQNTERLFFKNDTLRSLNVRSLIRPNSDATRRNAYWRMFGMDLAFGDINSPSNGQLQYVKAKTSNQQFVPLFEKYLSEIWQSYINANNSSGINTSDINIVVDLATQLRELLIARRGDVASAPYANQNLSREEFYSVLTASWFTFIISYDSAVVQFLNCQSSTIGERLIKIGNKVGIPAHNKCQSLFEMAGSASYILRNIENGGIFDSPSTMPDILKSLNPGGGGTAQNKNFMSDLLTIINNWEKATGHLIKIASPNIAGAVRVQPPLPSSRVQQTLPTNGKPVSTSVN